MKTLFNIREWIKINLLRPALLDVGKMISKWSPLKDQPLYRSEDFEWTKILEENWLIIKKELHSALELHKQLPSLQDIQQEQKYLNQDDKWKTFFFYGFGVKATLNCLLCPNTAAILESIPGMQTAFFSILSPYKHIQAHKGIYKGIIRAHLALLIPGEIGQCRMRVVNEMVYWKEGEVVVFDDTYDHEVWNDTNEIRAVLLLDVIRPFYFPFSLLNKALLKLIGYSSYVKEAARNHREWEKRTYLDRLKI